METPLPQTRATPGREGTWVSRRNSIVGGRSGQGYKLGQDLWLGTSWVCSGKILSLSEPPLSRLKSRVSAFRGRHEGLNRMLHRYKVLSAD